MEQLSLTFLSDFSSVGMHYKNPLEEHVRAQRLIHDRSNMNSTAVLKNIVGYHPVTFTDSSTKKNTSIKPFTAPIASLNYESAKPRHEHEVYTDVAIKNGFFYRLRRSWKKRNMPADPVQAGEDRHDPNHVFIPRTMNASLLNSEERETLEQDIALRDTLLAEHNTKIDHEIAFVRETNNTNNLNYQNAVADAIANDALMPAPRELIELPNRDARIRREENLIDESIINRYGAADKPEKAKEIKKRLMREFDRDEQPIIHVRNQTFEKETEVETFQVGTSTDDLEKSRAFVLQLQSDSSFFKPFNVEELKAKLRKKIFSCKASASLTYHLKIKHAFSVRNPALLTSMRADARVWLASKNFPMDSEEEYSIITSSVIAAYMIDPCEYAFYRLCQERNFWNGFSDYNSALSGSVDVTIPSKLSTILPGSKDSGDWRGLKRSLIFDKSVRLNYSTKHNTA